MSIIVEVVIPPKNMHYQRFPLLLLAVLAFAVSIVSARTDFEEVGAAQAEEVLVFEISKSGDFRKAQKLLDTSLAETIMIRISAGEYRLKRTLRINRSNVRIEGVPGAKLTLAKGVQAPVIAVGPQTEFPLEEERIWNVSIVDLEIDGNRDQQASEYDRHRPWIRNNGIDARTVSGLKVERVRCGNNRSGGLVISWRCRDVVARDCVFENNYFDGVAYYDSSQVYTVDCVMRDNRGAGVSIDNAVVDALFASCVIAENRDVGVFARNSRHLMFYETEVTGSGNWAFFLSHDDKELGVFDTEIASCKIVGNHGGVRMGSVDEKQSAGNRVVLCDFGENGSRGRPNLSTAGSPVALLEGGWNPDSESLAAEAPSRPYSKRLYQALNDFGVLAGDPDS